MGRHAETKSYPVHSIGPDDPYSLDEIPDDLKWLVYWYEAGDYEGSGTAIFQCADGTYGTEDLSHCSCYGPTENASWVGDMNANDVRKLLGTDKDLDRPRDPDDYDYIRWVALAPKVKELAVY